MDIFINGVILVATAVAMEGVAWTLHKYVMHGFLWVLHADHHNTSGRRWQKNDFFALFFAVISFLLINIGVWRGSGAVAAVGLGMALYGIAYFFVHDLMFHRRIKVFRYKPRSGYLLRVMAAHRVHHSITTKAGARSFGFLYAPKKYADGG